MLINKLILISKQSRDRLIDLIVNPLHLLLNMSGNFQQKWPVQFESISLQGS